MRFANLWRKLTGGKVSPDEEVAAPTVVGVRQGWPADAVTSTLSPKKLASIMQRALQGDADDLLALAEEMEECDAHYRAVLGARKRAVQRLQATVEPASDSKHDMDIAAALRRDVVERPGFRRLVGDLLDAIGKGYSVAEIMWDSSAVPWVPNLEWRDPRWFSYDYATGRTLMLRDLTDTQVPLTPAKFVVHEPRLKSGLQIRAGIAVPVTFMYLVKHMDVKGWAAFVEVFGYPLRLGKYSRRATAQDKRILARAVRNIGRDVGAVIPDSLMVEIVDGVKPGGTTNHFERLARWADDQMSKCVLGQTASVEGTPGKLGDESIQEEVRLDIVESDAAELEETLDRDLGRNYVDLNFGAQAAYPRIRIPVPRPEDVTALVENIAKLVPLGFRVRQADLYSRMRLTEPEEEDLMLEPASGAAAAPMANRLLGLLANASQQQAADELAELAAGENWEPLLRPLYEAVERLANDAGSYEEMQRRLPELLARIDPEGMTRRLTLAQTLARGIGDRDFASRE